MSEFNIIKGHQNIPGKENYSTFFGIEWAQITIQNIYSKTSIGLTIS
jgi:hypothetical protein